MTRETSALAAAIRRSPIGRIPVVGVKPSVGEGRFPAKSVVGEQFTVEATVFREGHDAVNATVVLTDPQGGETSIPMECDNPGLDHWQTTVSADRIGAWTYRVEGWSDPYGTWEHDAAIKVRAGVDVELMLEEGARVLERARDELTHEAAANAVVSGAITALRDQSLPVEERLNAGLAKDVEDVLSANPLRDYVSPTSDFDWIVERERALYGAWYEIFPRSEGATQDPSTGLWTSGTFHTAARRLSAIAGMGFDVVYLTPVHPIGHANRKGPNNTLNAADYDPGSPYGIGSPDGGHDALHPELGNFEDFDHFVAEARANGLEVAMDLALQASPDHPWAKDHPDWFTTRADGTIAYAENPPKKYQDIYPLNFDNDPDGIYQAVREVVQTWIDHGVEIFRVDNPHTKPLEFWQWLIADVAEDHPEVIWLAEAFTRPAMMHTLGMVGFQQSYTYYAWRNEKWELQEYMEELSGEAATYMRPSFWPTTHDILTPFMWDAGEAGWKMRAALAATLSPTYGIYTGYELMEAEPRPGAQEQLDNEKYQFKDREWASYESGGTRDGQSLAPYLTAINRIRNEHPSLHWLRNFQAHHADDESIMVFSKRRVSEGVDDVIIVVANLDPHRDRETTVRLNMEELGFGWGDTFYAHELLTDQHWTWRENNYVKLGPGGEPVHIIHAQRH